MPLPHGNDVSLGTIHRQPENITKADPINGGLARLPEICDLTGPIDGVKRTQGGGGHAAPSRFSGSMYGVGGPVWRHPPYKYDLDTVAHQLCECSTNLYRPSHAMGTQHGASASRQLRGQTEVKHGHRVVEVGIN